MDTQPTRAQQQEEDPPSRWNTRWYRFRFRFLRRLSRLLRMPQPTDINQALKSEGWKRFQDAKEHYLGHCPEHPEERLQRTEHGYFRCCQCWDEAYFRRLDSGPITDPHAQIQARGIRFPGRPIVAFNQAIQHGAGPHTAAVRAVPRQTKRLDTPNQERRQA